MNTVASLPDRLAMHARDCVKAADMDTDMVLSREQIDAMADDMAEAALALSEQGKVVITTDASGRCVAVTRQDGEGRILNTIWEASEHGGGGEAVAWAVINHCDGGKIGLTLEEPTAEQRTRLGECYSVRPLVFGDTTPPTPSAPTNLVPGVMACAKCKFRLVRTNLYVRNGTTGPGDNATEPCPNGCGPLWPVSWEQEARECWQRLEEMAAPPSAPVVDEAMARRYLSAQKAYVAQIDAAFGRQVAGALHQDDVVAACMAGLTAALSGVSAPVGVEGELRCADCGMRYASERWADFVVPDEAWVKISPTGHRGGVLCVQCMIDRATRAGIECIGQFTSGPFADSSWRKPAAAPRVETCGFCGKEGKHAAGESCPVLDGDGAPWKLTPAASEDELPELPEPEVRSLRLATHSHDGYIIHSYSAEQMRAYGEQCRRLAASGQGVEWRPIETAPKDGTEILACNDEVTLVTRWLGGGLTWYYRSDDYSVDDWSPTHWMPLPAAPTQEGK